jgi:hypothetical protein
MLSALQVIDYPKLPLAFVAQLAFFCSTQGRPYYYQILAFSGVTGGI